MTYNILDNKHKLNQLDWSIFEDQFRSYCVFDSTFQEFLSDKLEVSAINSLYLKVDQLSISLENQTNTAMLEDFCALSENLNFTRFINKISKEDYFDVEELNNYILALECSLNFFPDLHFEQDKQRNIQDFKKIKESLKRNFRSFVNTDGTIDYSKHPVLRKIYHQQLDIESKCRGKIQNCTQESSLKLALQFDGHDLINDRYVVAIKSDSYQYKFGSIVSRSESGRTLYVELPELSELNTQRLNCILEINKIIESLFKNFLKSLQLDIKNIHYLANLLLGFDRVRSRCLFNSIYELSKPSFTNHCSVKVKSFFHPLIENPIKNDITIKIEDAGLIISGPNTGGKTATIKTLVLIQLFIKKGLFVPATTCETYLFDKLFYFSHDNQDLALGLSSFSSEVKTYIQLLEELKDSNLVVIDEIFNSTSSEEASALAIGLFEQLLSFKNTKIIVSTHHQTLKSLIHAKDNYISAHVGFNTDSGLPTYNLHIGTPGASQAIEIFKSLSKDKFFSKEILEKALNILDKKMINYESLLEKISNKENQLNCLITENKRLKQEAVNIKESAKGLANLKISEEVNKANSKIKNLENELLETLKLVKQGEIKSKSTVLTRTSNVKHQLASLDKVKIETKDYSNLTKPNKLIPGKAYFSTFLNQTVTLKSLKGNKAFVMKGSMTINCPVDSLMLANSSKHIDTKVSAAVSLLPETNVSLEYDCRGMRLNDFESLVNEVIVGLYNNQVPYINFIHGHGEGVLKKWFRGFITKNKDLEIFSDNDGNDGQTRIRLIQ